MNSKLFAALLVVCALASSAEAKPSKKSYLKNLNYFSVRSNKKLFAAPGVGSSCSSASDEVVACELVGTECISDCSCTCQDGVLVAGPCYMNCRMPAAP